MPEALWLGETQSTYFNKQATWRLGAWLDSQLTLKEHHDIRIEKARNVQNRLRRLAGQVGPSPENCRRICPSRSELWWKGEDAHGTKNRQEDLQKLVNQEAWLTLGAFRTTNPGALSSESGLQPAPAFRKATKPGSSLERRVRSDNGCSHSSDAGTEEKKRSFSR